MINDSYTLFMIHIHSSWSIYTFHDLYTQFMIHIHSSWSIYTCHDLYTQLMIHIHSSWSTYTVHNPHTHFMINIHSTWSIYTVHDPHMKRNKFCAMFFCSIFSAKHVIANWPNLTVAAQNPTTDDLLKKWTCKYIMILLNWFLLVTKSSNWGIKINKTEIKNLKIENWWIVYIYVWIFVWC